MNDLNSYMMLKDHKEQNEQMIMPKISGGNHNIGVNPPPPNESCLSMYSKLNASKSREKSKPH